MSTAEKNAVSTRTPETPAWFYKFGRTLIALFLFAMAGAYDISVAEVSGDLRWIMIHATAMILITAYFIACLGRPLGKPRQMPRAERTAHPDPRKNDPGGRRPPGDGSKTTLNFPCLESVSRMPFIIWLVAFLAIWSALSMLWTLSPYHSWWSLKHLLGYTVLFAFVYLLRSEKWYMNLLWIAALGVGFNSLIAIAQFHDVGDARLAAVFPPWKYITAGFSALLRNVYFLSGTDRTIADTLPFFHQDMLLDLFRQAFPPAGTQSNKNLLGSYLVLTLPAVFYLFLSGRNNSGRFIAAMLFTMGTVALLYTRSRASWFSALCAVIFFTGWLLSRRQYRRIVKPVFAKPALALLAVVCLVVIGGGNLRSKPGVRSVIEQFRTLVRMPVQDDCDTLAVRIAYNLNGLAMIRDRPFCGAGLGAFHAAYPAYYRAVRQTPPSGFSMTARPSRMHDDLGQAFVELGIFGGLAYIGIFLTLLLMAWRIGEPSAKSDPEPTPAHGHPSMGDSIILALCLMTGIIGLGINSLADFPMQLPLTPSILWIFAGMLTGLYVMRVESADI